MTRKRMKERVLNNFRKKGEAWFSLGENTYHLINKESSCKYSLNIGARRGHTYYIVTDEELEYFLNDYMKEAKKRKIQIWKKENFLKAVENEVKTWKGTGLKGGVTYLWIYNSLKFKATDKNLLNYPA